MLLSPTHSCSVIRPGSPFSAGLPGPAGARGTCSSGTETCAVVKRVASADLGSVHCAGKFLSTLISIENYRCQRRGGRSQGKPCDVGRRQSCPAWDGKAAPPQGCHLPRHVAYEAVQQRQHCLSETYSLGQHLLETAPTCRVPMGSSLCVTF